MPTLEERVAALEATSKADSIAPVYLTLDPVTGKVGANFTGHVHGAGFDLDEQSTNDVVGQASGLVHALSWLSGPNPITSLYDVITAPDGVSRLNIWKKIAAQAFTYELLGSDDTSDYLRWGNTHGGGSGPGAGSTAKVEFGTGTVQVTNAARGTGTITHGLGRTPTAVLVSGNDQGAGFIMAWTAGVFTSTQFNVAVDTNQVVTLLLHFSWIAIG